MTYRKLFKNWNSIKRRDILRHSSQFASGTSRTTQTIKSPQTRAFSRLAGRKNVFQTLRRAASRGETSPAKEISPLRKMANECAKKGRAWMQWYTLKMQPRGALQKRFPVHDIQVWFYTVALHWLIIRKAAIYVFKNMFARTHARA